MTRSSMFIAAMRAVPALAVLTMIGAVPAAAQAEVTELRIAVQFGIGYLPLLVAEDQALIENHLRAEGIANTKISFVRLNAGPALNEAILSRSIDLAAYGTGGFITAWDKTRGTLNIKGLCASPISPSRTRAFTRC